MTDDIDISPEEVAFALSDVPVGSFPPEALIPKEKMLSIFGDELDTTAFDTLGDLAMLGVTMSGSPINAFKAAGDKLNSRMRELVHPK